MTWRSLLFSAKGRINRADYWIVLFLLNITAAVLALLGVIGVLLSLLIAWPHVCIFSKRLHDIGRSGWWAAAGFALAGVGELARGLANALEPESAVSRLIVMAAAVCVLAAIILCLRVGLKRGDATENRFGSPARPLLYGRGARAPSV